MADALKRSILLAGVAMCCVAAAGAERQAIPDSGSQEKALRLVRQLFKDEYSKTDRDAKAALARRLIHQATETDDDIAARYVLFREARDLASAVAEAGLALRAVEQMGQAFDIPLDEMRLTVLMAAARASDSQRAEMVARAALACSESMARDEKFDLASRLAGLAETAARKSRQLPVLAKVQKWLGELRSVQLEHQLARDAMATLAKSPDAAAKAATGRYLCFFKGQWPQGLALLAEGNDAALSALAARDLAGPVDPTEQLKLANDWWELAQKHNSLFQAAIAQRAGRWYQAALPDLAGLSKTLAQQRLAEIDAQRMRQLHLEPGLAAELFEGQDFTDKKIERIDAQVDFDFGTDAPADGMPKDDFSIRWTGTLKVPARGKYTLIVQANSGARLTIGDRIVIDNGFIWRKRTGERITIELADGLHPLLLEYWDGGGEANIKLLWIVPGSSKETTIPADCLYHDAMGK